MKHRMRLFAALCAGAVSLSCLPAAPAQSLSQNAGADDYSIYAADHYAPLWGDVNMDNSLYRSDLIALQQYVDGTLPDNWFTPSINADTDGNGIVNSKDVDVLQKWIAARAAGEDPDAVCAEEKAAWKKHYVYPHEFRRNETYNVPTSAFGAHQGILTFTVTATKDTVLTYGMRIPTTDKTGYIYWKSLTELTNIYWDNWRDMDDGSSHPQITLKAGVPYTIAINIENLWKAPDSYYALRIYDWDNPDARVYLTGMNVIDVPDGEGSPFNFSFDSAEDHTVRTHSGEEFTVPVRLSDSLPYKKLQFTVRYPEFIEYENSYFSENVNGQEITVLHDRNARTLTYTMESSTASDASGAILQMRYRAGESVPERDALQMFEFIGLDAYAANGDHYRCTGQYADFLITDADEAVMPLVTTGNTLASTTFTTTTVTFTTEAQTSAQTTDFTESTTSTATAAGGVTGTTEPLFQWGQDNWNFDNNSMYFKTQKYYVEPHVRDTFMDLFTTEPVERRLLLETIDYNNTRTDWNGSCFGMTLTEILVRQGMLDLSLFGGNPVVNRNSNTPEMLSLINLMQAVQGTSFSQEIRQCALLSGPDTVPQDKYIKKLEETLLQGKLVKIGTTKRITQFLMPEDDARRTIWSNHAVLAYGIEECDYHSAFTGKDYDRRILIADPNRLRQNALYDDACIYYNSQDQSWIIPEYCSETKRIRYACCWNSGSAYADNGFINNLMTFESPTEANSLMSAYHVDNYIAGAEFQGSDPLNAVMGVVLASGNPALDYDSDEEDNIILYGMEYNDAEERTVSVNYALVNPTSRYYLAYADKCSDYNVRMDYENTAYFAKAGNAKYMEFAPDGELLLKGSDTDYDITLVSNSELCTTDWYALRVLGSGADSMTLSRHEKGYVFYADSMENITISAENDAHRAAVTFSVPEPCKVLVYEIDEDTLGILADTDGDGAFETAPDTEKTSLLAGDLNCDGEMSIADAVLLMRVLAEDSAVNVTNNGLYNAELDRDSLITVDDVRMLLYLLSHETA